MMKKARQTYEGRAALFAKACDIGYEILSKAEIPEGEKERLMRQTLSVKEMALNPWPQYKRLASLKILEAEHFWYWNESPGSHISEHWKKIAKAELPYKRKDDIRSVLKRKRIKDITEFDFLKDELLVAQQTGRVTSEEAETLSKIMVHFEFKDSNGSLASGLA